MLKDPFTHQIIGLAMETHRALGPGLVEEFYHRDLVARLTTHGIEHLSKPRQDLVFRDHIADTFEADIVFPGKLILELKALRSGFDGEHFTQLLSYNKFWRIRTGMLFDFGKPSLISKRVIYTSKTGEFSKAGIPAFISDKVLARRLIQTANQTLSDIGLGYRATTWNGLISAAFRAEQLSFAINPTVNVAKIGIATLRCLLVANQSAIAISALGDEVSAIDRACLQTCLNWLGLPWGICFHFGKATADIKFVAIPKNNLRVL